MLPLTFALLALGLIVVVIAVDLSDEDAIALKNIDGVQCICSEEMGEDFLKPLFERRNFHCCFLSFISHSDSWQRYTEQHFSGTIICIDIKNDCTSTASANHGACFKAGSFGYIQNDVACTWYSNRKRSKFPSMPPGIIINQDGGSSTFLWEGPKAMPPKPRLEGNASLPFEPTTVVSNAGKGGIFPSAIASRTSRVIYGASKRRLLDSEVLFLLGYPRSLNLRDPSLTEAEGSSVAARKAARLPNVHAVAFLVWLSLMIFKGEALTSRWAYFPDEKLLRSQVKGTCWDPTIGPNFPGLISRSILISEMQAIPEVSEAHFFELLENLI